jgi:hypothetical protein
MHSELGQPTLQTLKARSDLSDPPSRQQTHEPLSKQSSQDGIIQDFWAFTVLSLRILVYWDITVTFWYTGTSLSHSGRLESSRNESVC